MASVHIQPSTPKSIDNIIMEKTRRSIREAYDFIGEVMPNRLRQAFVGPAPSQGRTGLTPWDRTSRAALMARVNYPKSASGERTGVKGFTKKQAGYLHLSPTLRDTGRLEKSIQVVSMDTRGNKEWTMEISSKNVPYAITHLAGGTITVNGVTYDVPIRDFLLLTRSDTGVIKANIEHNLRSA